MKTQRHDFPSKPHHQTLQGDTVSFDLSPVTLRVLQLIEDAGGEAWCVGGFVRDSLMGRPTHDVDIACSLPWQHTQQIFDTAGCKTIETGTRHGTLTVIMDSTPFEITTYRSEGAYSDGRHPDCVSKAESIEEDLKRRDFTMNAMAYHPQRGLLDPFGGRADLEQGILRCVGDPMKRFKEDALRILRACRFVSQLGVGLDKATYEAMLASKSLLHRVSVERIYHELEGFVTGEHVHDALMELVDVLAFVLPELVAMKDCPQVTKYHIYDVLEHTAYVVAQTPPVPLTRWAALFHDMGKPAAAFFEGDVEHFYGHGFVSENLARGIMHRLRFPADLQRDIPLLVRIHDDQIPATKRAVRRALARMAARVDLFQALCDLKKADALSQAPHCHGRVELADDLSALLREILDEDAAFSLKQLAVSGRDLMDLGMTAGPQLGTLLQALLDAVIDERVANEREALLAFAQELAEASQ